MIENLQSEQKQAKAAKNIRSWRAKKSPKHSSKYLKDRIRKIKQYLNYILMITKSKYSSNPMNILKSAKKYMNLCAKCTSTLTVESLPLP